MALILDLDFSDSSVLFQNAGQTTAVSADAQPIGGVNDKSSANNDGSQSTSASRSIYKQNIINSRSVSRGDGSDDYLQAAASGTSLSALSIYLVFRTGSNVTDSRGVFSWAEVAESGNPFLALQLNDGTVQLYVDGNYRFSISVSANTAYRIAIRYDETTWRCRVNGTEQTAYIGGTTFKSYASGIYLHSSYGGKSDTDIGQIRVYDAYLSGSTDTTEESYFYNKWFVSAPVISTASLPDAIIGASYSQQLAATGGTGSLTWSLVSGSLPVGLSLSSTGLISGTPTISGTASFTVRVTDSASITDQKALTITVGTAPPLPYGFERTGIELFCEANQMSQSNGSNVSSFTDQSSYARHLTAASGYPTFQTNIINGKPVIRSSGSQNPLTNNATFPIHCGWILAKYNGTTFPDYKGLLTDLSNQVVFVGDAYGTKWFSGNYDVFECRSNDRIYPQDAAPAPMNQFKLIFFKFWKPAIMTGVQLFQDRNFTARKWNGDVALVILASRGYCEQEIRARSLAISAAYGLSLADVYPYNGSKDSPQTFVQSVNVYDPPEGDRIAEVLGNQKRIFDLQFNSRRTVEVRAMIPYHQSHYPDVACIYRNYNLIPPEDIEGYIDSPYQLKGSVGEYDYSFRFKEK